MDRNNDTPNFSHNGGRGGAIDIAPTDGLSDLLEKFYKAFDLGSYLDQIGIIDYRIAAIKAEVEELYDNFPDLAPDFDRLRLLIDSDWN